MAKYRVLEKSFINNQIVEEGEIVDYDSEPSFNLEAVEEKTSDKKAAGKAAE